VLMVHEMGFEADFIPAHVLSCARRLRGWQVISSLRALRWRMSRSI
jgi:hypothetical protein